MNSPSYISQRRGSQPSIASLRRGHVSINGAHTTTPPMLPSETMRLPIIRRDASSKVILNF